MAYSSIYVPMMWIAVVNQNLSPLGLTQEDTGYIVTIIIISAVVMNIVNSRISDMFFGHFKIVICVFLSISLCASIWLILLMLGVVHILKSYVYISSIVSMVSLRCIIALFYELLIEVHYPTPESLVILFWGQVSH